MKRSQVASDILDQLRTCLGDECGGYQFRRTRGIPPADCNSITTSWIDRSVEKFQDCDSLDPGCQTQWESVHGLRIAITRVCIGADAAEVFDWQREDAEAACFDDHVDLIEECLQCSDFSVFTADHSIYQIRYDSTTYDVEADGGGFSAYIEVTIRAAECCPTPVP